VLVQGQNHRPGYFQVMDHAIGGKLIFRRMNASPDKCFQHDYGFFERLQEFISGINFLCFPLFRLDFTNVLQRFFLFHRETYLKDRIRGTLWGTFPAEFARNRIDKGQVVLHCYGIVRTDFKTLCTADACHGTVLFRDATLVLVHAGNVNLFMAFPSLPQFKQIFGAGFYAGTAGCAFIVIHNGKSRYRIHLQGIKCAGNRTITQSKTAILTSGISSVQRRSNGT
jgi:hypothetical protein